MSSAAASDVVELSAEEIALRVEAMRASREGSQPPVAEAPVAGEAPPPYRFVRPLTQAADSLIQYIQNVDGRFMFGLPELDMKTRGIGRGELAYLTGYTHCVDTETEILTRRGWLRHDDLRLGDVAWSLNTTTGEGEWAHVTAVNVADYQGKMLSIGGGRGVDALVTPEHKWPTTSQWNVKHGISGYELTKTVEMNTSDYIPRAVPGAASLVAIHDDLWVEEVALYPEELLTHELVDELTLDQRRLLVSSLFEGIDGHHPTEANARYETLGSTRFVAKLSHLFSAAGYGFSCTKRAAHSFGRWNWTWGREMHVFTLHTKEHWRWARTPMEWVEYDGQVWCPTTTNGTWFARRNGKCYWTGNSGKTQLALTGICNNRDRRIVLVTMDETAEQVLTKLVCMLTGSNAERLEDRVKAGDQAAIDRVRKIAAVDFANLVVVDGGMRLEELSTVVQEAESHFDGPIDLLGLDYLDLLKTEDSNTEQKSQALKAWVTSQPFPVLAIHQGSRGNSGGGQKLSMNSMKYAGEAEATFVIGVRRLRDDPDMEGVPGVEDTVEVHLIKNKRPPSRIGEHTYYLKPESGLILPLDQMPRRH